MFSIQHLALLDSLEDTSCMMTKFEALIIVICFRNSHEIDRNIVVNTRTVTSVLMSNPESEVDVR